MLYLPLPTMLANANLICCNFCTIPSSPLKRSKIKALPRTHNLKRRNSHFKTNPQSLVFSRIHNDEISTRTFQRKECLQICRGTLNKQNSEDRIESELDKSKNVNEGGNWTTSILLFLLWGALLYYVFNLAPNQTPSTDMYFLQKLLNLNGDDGFKMNEVIVSLWYIMGLWPLVYSMLLLPTGRSSKSKVPVWPFVLLSFFGGAYALIPYFVLWRPPPPSVDETELSRWPLNFLESKLTAGISLVAGLGIIIYAGLAGEATWKEFFQYFGGSKFIHVTCLDFSLLSTFAPFWVYNDMTSRKWFDKGYWLLPFSLIPFVGPALYILLRPSLSATPGLLKSTTAELK